MRETAMGRRRRFVFAALRALLLLSCNFFFRFIFVTIMITNTFNLYRHFHHHHHRHHHHPHHHHHQHHHHPYHPHHPHHPHHPQVIESNADALNSTRPKTANSTLTRSSKGGTKKMKSLGPRMEFM